MIAMLNGSIKEKRPDQIIIMAGHVGYRVFVSLNTFYDLPATGEESFLHIHTVVREDAIHLYGFSQETEKETFSRLISISGIGPKVALSMLSGIAPLELWQAVRARDAERLTKIPGIGKKTAARLVVELEGKLPQGDSGQGAFTAAPLEADAMSALLNLGYPEAMARKALDGALAVLGNEPSLPELLKASLMNLGGSR